MYSVRHVGMSSRTLNTGDVFLIFIVVVVFVTEGPVQTASYCWDTKSWSPTSSYNCSSAWLLRLVAPLDSMITRRQKHRASHSVVTGHFTLSQDISERSKPAVFRCVGVNRVYDKQAKLVCAIGGEGYENIGRRSEKTVCYSRSFNYGRDISKEL